MQTVQDRSRTALHSFYDGSKELGDGIKKLNDGSETLQTSLSDGAKQVKETKANDDMISMFAAPVKEGRNTDDNSGE